MTGLERNPLGVRSSLCEYSIRVFFFYRASCPEEFRRRATVDYVSAPLNLTRRSIEMQD